MNQSFDDSFELDDLEGDIDQIFLDEEEIDPEL